MSTRIRPLAALIIALTVFAFVIPSAQAASANPDTVAAPSASSQLNANNLPQTMTGFAGQIPNGDLSMQLTEALFGPVWRHMITSNGVQMNAQGSGYLIGRVAFVLNLAALALTGFILLGTLMTSVLSTGHEGVALGQKYSTLWVPIRSSLAILMLMPVAAGYSLSMAGIMWIGRAGAGVADTTEQYALNYVSTGGIVVPPTTSGSNEVGAKLLQSEVCMLSANQEHAGTIVFKTQGKTTGKKPWRMDYTPTSKTGLTTNICGSYTVPGVQQVHNGFLDHLTRSSATATQAQAGVIAAAFDVLWKEVSGSESKQLTKPAMEMRRGNIAALKKLRSNLKPIAQQIVAGKQPSGKNYAKALYTYHKDMTQNAKQIAKATRKALKSSTNAQGKATQQGSVMQTGLDQIKKCGWICSGAIYWSIIGMSDKAQKLLDAHPTGNGPNSTDLSNHHAGLADVSDRLQRANRFVNRYSMASVYDNNDSSLSSEQKFVQRTSAMKKSGGVSAHNFISNWINKYFHGIADQISQAMAANANPVMNGKEIGNDIVGAAEGMYLSYLGSSAVDSGVSKSDLQYIPIIGGGLKVLAGFVTKLAPLAFTIFMTLLMLGLLLAFWLPAIPMVLWIFASINWLILLFEGLWATLVWAPAHGIPEGEGWAGQHARAGWMVVLALFMTPALMMAGLFSAMVVISAAGRLIAALYPLVLGDGNVSSLLGLVGFAAALAILTLLYIVAADRSFAMIHLIRDKILRWISGPSESFGEFDDVNRTKMMMGGVATRFEGLANSQMSPSADDPNKSGGGGKGGSEGGGDTEDYMSSR